MRKAFIAHKHRGMFENRIWNKLSSSHLAVWLYNDKHSVRLEEGTIAIHFPKYCCCYSAIFWVQHSARCYVTAHTLINSRPYICIVPYLVQEQLTRILEYAFAIVFPTNLQITLQATILSIQISFWVRLDKEFYIFTNDDNEPARLACSIIYTVNWIISAKVKVQLLIFVAVYTAPKILSEHHCRGSDLLLMYKVLTMFMYMEE